MRSLPHVTIACGAIWAGSRLLRVRAPEPAPDNGAEADAATDTTHQAEPGDNVDYRLVAIGSLLPDLVDRAQRRVFRMQGTSPHQHFIGHTLLFNLPLLAAGNYLLRRRRDTRLLSVSAAVMTHLMVDPVIRSPGTLFWPLFGFRFPEARGLPPGATAVTQVAAGIVVLATVLSLLRRNRLQQFITSGRL